MQSWQVLPRVSLQRAGDMSRRFVAQGILPYRDAGRYVHHLPYGRNSDRANTPGVGPVLDRYGLNSIPEAHCYLRYARHRIDVTRAGLPPAGSVPDFVTEVVLLPEQIGRFKISWHQRFLQAWRATEVSARRFSFEDIWKIRERCIAALAQ